MADELIARFGEHVSREDLANVSLALRWLGPQATVDQVAAHLVAMRRAEPPGS